MIPECETRTPDGQYVFTYCATTGAEGVFSGQQVDSLRRWDEEHAAAHRAHHARRFATMQAQASRGHRSMQYGLRYS